MSGKTTWKDSLAAHKPKAAIYRLMGCGGCDEAIMDLNDLIFTITDTFDIVLWPMAMDSNYENLQAMKDGEIAFSIVHGAVRNAEQERMARLLREKSQTILAFGACACFGGMPDLADLSSKKSILIRERGSKPQSPGGLAHRTEPEAKQDMYEMFRPLNRIIRVDYFLPGCPPPASLLVETVSAGLDNKLPPPSDPMGATLAPGKALCSSCPRNRSKPARIEIPEFKRIHEIEADERCFLAQGIVCLGPVIRSGCGETCMRINLPCRGCFGPADGVRDTGLNFISGLASLISAEADEDVRKVLDTLVDLSGILYRFGLPFAGAEANQEGGTDHAKDRHPSDHVVRRAREDRTVPRR